jgi:hypothetical protein
MEDCVVVDWKLLKLKSYKQFHMGINKNNDQH